MLLVDFMGHLVSDESEEELHRFAKEKLSMKRSWYQNSTTTLKHPHYDLTTHWMIEKAKELGAEWVTPQDLVRRAYWSKEEKNHACKRRR